MDVLSSTRNMAILVLKVNGFCNSLESESYKWQNLFTLQSR